MPARGDRQELVNPREDAENDALEQVHDRRLSAGGLPGTGLAPSVQLSVIRPSTSGANAKTPSSRITSPFQHHVVDDVEETHTAHELTRHPEAGRAIVSTNEGLAGRFRQSASSGCVEEAEGRDRHHTVPAPRSVTGSRQGQADPPAREAGVGGLADHGRRRRQDRCSVDGDATAGRHRPARCRPSPRRPGSAR